MFYSLSCILTQFVSCQILTDAALLKRQKKEIEELRSKLQVFLIVIISLVFCMESIMNCFWKYWPVQTSFFFFVNCLFRVLIQSI